MINKLIQNIIGDGSSRIMNKPEPLAITQIRLIYQFNINCFQNNICVDF